MTEELTEKHREMLFGLALLAAGAFVGYANSDPAFAVGVGGVGFGWFVAAARPGSTL
jgi:hypothetical protein